MICPFCKTNNPENSVVCIACGVSLKPDPHTTGRETGAPDWECYGRLFNIPSFFITVKEVLFTPVETFAGLKKDSALFNAFLFGLVGGSVGALFSTFWSSLIGLFGFLPHDNEMMRFLGNTENFIIALFITPVLTALGLFIISGMLHLCLMFTGGSNLQFYTTFKVFSYTHGATALLNIVPIFGSFVAFFWSIYINISGLKAAHKISFGQALFAVLLPLVLCCACVAMAGCGLFISGLGMLQWLKTM
jgi:hypothetical protein